MSKPIKKINLSPKDFRVGFELEFKSQPLKKKYGDAWDLAFRSRYIKLPNKVLEDTIKVGVDGPLWELRTLPVCGSKAKKTLKDAFFILNHFKATTTKTCGLHINVSCKRKSLHKNLDPIKLYKNLEPKKLAKLFGRQSSRYCQCPSNNKPWTVFEFCSDSIESYSKHFGINFKNYHTTPRRTSRIEFRFLGGKNYNRKERLSYKVLNDIIKALSKSYVK